MIVFAMDETGKFEEGELSPGRCSMIGGFGFRPDGDDDRAVGAERNRIEAFLRSACRQVEGAVYPNDLHLNDAGSNRDTTDAVKNVIFEGLKSFLNGESIPWAELAPMRGKYYLHGILVDGRRSPVQAEGEPGNLIDDRYAANRYEHAAYRLFENLLLNDPRLTEDALRSVHLEIATRKCGLTDQSRPELRVELNQLGYERRLDPKTGERDHNSFIVTDSASFRAALSQILIDSGKQVSDVTLKVQSIGYGPRDNNMQAFLYFADVICSFYARSLYGCGSCGEAALRLAADCRRLLPASGIMLWTYSREDEAFRTACRAGENQDVFLALSTMAEMSVSASLREGGDRPSISAMLSRFYDEQWFEWIRKRLKEKTDPDALQLASIQLLNYIGRPDYKLRVASRINEDLYELAAGYESAKKYDGTMRYPELFAGIYRCRMALFNHHGDHVRARQEYEKLFPLARHLSPESYVGIRNMMSVALSDAGEYEDAALNAVDTVDFVEEINRVYRKYDAGKTVLADIMLGRALSQRGQCYSYLQDYPSAFRDFEKALEHLADSPNDVGRTRSYYLHALIEAGDREKYEEQARLYFGSGILNDQLKKISENDTISDKYALYVYIKARYLLYKDDQPMSMSMVDRIASLYQRSRDGHPWEMILKYCAFFALAAGDRAKAGDLMRLSGETMDSADASLQALLDGNARQFRRLSEGLEPFDPEDTRLVYMYR